ncbi:hypothetical protein Vadar_006650 [Vaccinium darrowii]|uniref:Uncharacterized protein n=1 Tax=Vaccinium darrowii TaxID=229202 RepID=A0ACB7XX31_9ERIC|nr:hypothetical protein Vadar_006650 [Vaccinium darrowii]
MEQISHVEEQVSITVDKNEIPKSDSEDCSVSSSAFDDFWYFNRDGLAKLEQGNGRYKIIHKVRAWEKTQMLQPSLKSHDLAPLGEVDWKLPTLSLVKYPPNVEGMLMPSMLGTGDLETESVETYPMDSVDALRGMIFQQRVGKAINLDMIKARIDLFVEVDHKGKRYYYRKFEQVLLSHIDVRRAKLANEWLLTCSFHEYLKKALNCMYIEEKRMGHYLPRNTMANMVVLCVLSLKGKCLFLTSVLALEAY